jgi:nitroimidazol reductase NimA-like FMN-containing flavoprotein (pyridoxamine 5'-phosphate oxidase superfamily)
VGLGGGGYLVLTHPWPAIARTIWGDPDRYVQTYFSAYGPSIYVAGDGARLDEDGYFWLLGRIDDVMNVAGHRLSTFEIESALVDNPAVAEAAVVSRPDELKGEGIVAFVTLRTGYEGNDDMLKELRNHVAKVIGPIAKPDNIVFTPDLPKTRSGKIMRRLLRDVARGNALGDVTTLANEEIVHQIHEQVDHLATVYPDGRPHVVPISPVLDLDRLVFASEETQKIANIRANPSVAISFDHYTEVWGSLQGVVVHGEAYLVDAGFEFRRDRELLYEKFSQYATDAPIEEGESVIVEVRVDRVVSWGF